MTDDPADDPRVLSLAREYLAELEAGRSPQRAGYEGRYPEMREAVAEFLDGVEMAHAAGIVLRPSVPTPMPEISPEPLGDFRILREIGRGGMGVVYEAMQLSLGRRVALKVLPFAAGLDAKHLQRFKTEAHAAAQLHHTNIVPVYAVGQDRGTHYYAMQLIDGRPLDAVIRELRDDKPRPVGESTVDVVANRSTAAPVKAVTVSLTAGTTRRHRTAFATAARFAAQVADALEYAHDAGVIHRDIKPANLLLDAKGTVWVTDFGLAQVQAEANVTRTGDVFGTLRYSSPEQATGRRTEVDHRTDVYSLGATLYELLTLQPIFPDTDRHSLLYRIINEDPVAPRVHDKNIPPELETIVLKAVAKSPQDRYQTAGEFAADLRRFLDDRPILARRPTLIDHARKWLRRHPAYSYAAMVVLLITAVGFGISTLVVNEAKRQAEGSQKETEDALDREKQRAKEAEERFRIARRLADEHIRVANEDLAYDPVQESLRQRMLQTALAYYQEFIDLRKDDPAAVGDLAAVRDQVTGILAELAVMAGADRLDLLRYPAVWDALKLSKSDGERLKGMLDADPPDLGGFGGTSLEQINAQQLERARRLDSVLRRELTADQWKRLSQIFIQRRGPKAFDLQEVIDALKLTTEDRAKLRQAERIVFAKRIESGFGGPGGPGGFGGPGGAFGGPGGPGNPGMFGGGMSRGGGKPPDRGPFGGGPGGEGGRRGPGGEGPHDRGAGDGRRQEGQFGRVMYIQFNQSVVTDMLAVLKPEQEAQWKQLIGEPFTKLDQLFQFRPFGPPEGGGPGGGPGGGHGGPGGPGGSGGSRPAGGRG